MVPVNLEDCSKCRFLPPLGQLPALLGLFIKGMTPVEIEGSDFYGEGSLAFPLLEHLSFQNMQGWKEWISFGQHQGAINFPCLKKLSIYACPKLEGMVPENLDSLEEFVVRECDQLVVSIANYKELSVLCIRYCKGVAYRSVADFQLLDLEITGCGKLTCSLQSENGNLKNFMPLRHLTIDGNSDLLQLHHLSLLQELHIDKWPSLESFSLSSLPPSLKDIKIRGCDSLTCFARYQIPPSLRRIEINRCQNMKSLGEDEEVIGDSSSSYPCLIRDEESCLEYLSIWNCPSLISLSSKVKLPRAHRHSFDIKHFSGAHPHLVLLKSSIFTRRPLPPPQSSEVEYIRL
ncbi:putative disease resistance RPP13-like protein 1 [Argentina anserina]|uniref:putative disease resistance RPP13-like protein 1 n=1 Tax=Argentina anserina TaxID=57926 RepID=UPI00217638FD|nr:putative disease resistance RPP13-like protein 1 [Potentilla anserina]